jgi:hypothetical protein
VTVQGASEAQENSGDPLIYRVRCSNAEHFMENGTMPIKNPSKHSGAVGFGWESPCFVTNNSGHIHDS